MSFGADDMKWLEAKEGRIFVIRLEDDEIIHDCIERFARENGVKSAFLILLGGTKKGNMVVGPNDEMSKPVEPMISNFLGVHEILAVGTVFPDEQGTPIAHIHGALGRGDHTLVGCLRKGIHVWEFVEVLLIELIVPGVLRKRDDEKGYYIIGIDPR